MFQSSRCPVGIIESLRANVFVLRHEVSAREWVNEKLGSETNPSDIAFVPMQRSPGIDENEVACPKLAVCTTTMW